MGELRIGVSLDSAPAMLRSIILEALSGVDRVGVVHTPPGQFAPSCHAMVLVDDAAPRAHLRGRVIGVVNFDSKTARGELWQRGQEPRTIDEFSVEALLNMVQSVRNRQVPAQRHPWWDPRSWFAQANAPEKRKRRPPPVVTDLLTEDSSEKSPPMLRVVPSRAALPEPTLPPGDPVTGELTRIAAKFAASMPPAPVGPGPAGDLHDLVKTLAEGGRALYPAPLVELERIVGLFDLSEDERDLLFMAAVVEIEPNAARLVALLNGQPSRSRPTVGLVSRWGGDLRALAERLSRQSALLRYGLVQIDGEGALSTRTVSADPAVWSLLFGMERALPFSLERHSEPPIGAPDVIGEAESVAALGAAIAQLARRADKRLLVAVAGAEDTGRERIATAIAQRCGEARLVVDGVALSDLAALAVLEREALLAAASVVLRDPQLVPEPVWKALNDRFAGMLIVTCLPEQVGQLALSATRAVTRFNAPERDAAQRVRLWSAVAPRGWTADNIVTIADRFDFGERRIAAALANARAQAEAEGRRDITLDEVQQACRALRDAAFAGSAELIEARYEPHEIVLRAETQRELDMVRAWARHSSRLFGQNGSGAALHAGGGLACLFSGPPGTGKTMAAQIIAGEIDYALYRVDLSQVVDKYIGEGEKRISGLFREASRARVALFFDEADALFGKRSDVKSSHDRYANIAVNHLLQELEGFDGLAILATNFAANIDSAFLRRIRVKADFIAPDFAERRQIWERMLPDAALEHSDIDLDWLAREHDLVGGEIRNAIYAAHLLAAEDPEAEGLAMRHCLAGLMREIGKTGRVVDSPRLRDVKLGCNPFPAAIENSHI